MRPRRGALTTALLAAAVWILAAGSGLGVGAGIAPAPAAAAPTAPRQPIPRRIIAVAPSAAELLYALGLGDRVVGVGQYVAWPPAAIRLPRLGGLLDPRLETVVALHPDLAVLLPSERELGERLTALGIEVLVLPHETVADVERAALTLARRAGVSAAGERFVRDFRRRLAPSPVPGHPRLLLVAERERGQLAQLLLAGPHTFLDELAARLGATNAFADAPLAWPQVALEEVVARRPTIIVELQPRALSPAEIAALRADWRAVPGLPVGAVKVAVVAGDWALVPGPRLPILYEALRRALLTATPP
ncbi:MAG TPA: helical backbone metal receptor [Thermoanaerobaculia bacterium]|nr:helical backbone metal receptor [Thermoanaerobaculia bacterium]